jgi:hypothetical protein
VESANIKKRDITFSFSAANIYAMLFVVPIVVILFVTYSLYWGIPKIVFTIPHLFVFIIGIIVHEMIHGIFAAKYSVNGSKSIKFGFSWKFLTPYCHCKETLKVRDYRKVVLSPLIILGIIPTVISFIYGQNIIFIFGIFFIIAAGGDILIFWKLRNENRNTLVLDSPDKCGCEIYEMESIDEK